MSQNCTCRHLCRRPLLHEVDEDLLPRHGRLQPRVAGRVVGQQERDGECRRLCWREKVAYEASDMLINVTHNINKLSTFLHNLSITLVLKFVN